VKLTAIGHFIDDEWFDITNPPPVDSENVPAPDKGYEIV